MSGKSGAEIYGAGWRSLHTTDSECAILSSRLHYNKGANGLMTHEKITMEHDKKIALVAHDNMKRDLVEWAKYNRDLLAHHRVYATGTTGKILEKELGFEITK